MCIIVDPPLFISIFKSDDSNHEKYKPVLNFIDRVGGKFVIGGSLYEAELKGVASILRHLTEYEKKGKVIKMDKAQTDSDVLVIKTIEPSVNFDDPHLVALVRMSGSKLICVNDPRSHKYLRASKFYNSTKDRPKLYTRPKNAAILCATNIPARYR